MKSVSLHKGGVKHDDQEDIEKDCNNLQVQELLLSSVFDAFTKKGKHIACPFLLFFPATTLYIATPRSSS